MFEEEQEKVAGKIQQQMMKSGLFQQVGVISGMAPVFCDGVLANGHYFFFRARGNCASFRVEEFAESGICLTYFEEVMRKKLPTGGFDPFYCSGLPSEEAKTLMLDWAREYLSGIRRWDDDFWFPGDAFLEAIEIDQAVIDALAEDSEIDLADADNFETYVLSRTKARLQWQRDARSFVKVLSSDPSKRIRLALRNDPSALVVEGKLWNDFEDNTIVYISVCPGYYHLIVVTIDKNGEKRGDLIVRQQMPEKAFLYKA